MHQRLAEVTEVIEQATGSLSRGYQAEQLYALRVAMRRLRSMLKPIGSTRSRRFRKIWGGFAAVTNRARDWDVFLLTATELLSPEQFNSFERCHRAHIRASHEAVVELLQAPHWRRHLQDWREYLQHACDSAEQETPTPLPLARALLKARAALATAQLLDDDRAWHKLRIAVKEVRYLAESGATECAAESPGGDLVEQCKEIQSLLGSWHDCVVQLQMLREMDAAPEQEILGEKIAARKIQRLAEIQHTVAAHPLFDSAPNSAASARSRSSSGS